MTSPAISMETDTSAANIKIPQSLTIAPVIETGSHRIAENSLTSPINLSINNKVRYFELKIFFNNLKRE